MKYMHATNSFVDESVYNLHNWPHFAEKRVTSLWGISEEYHTTSTMEYTISIV